MKSIKLAAVSAIFAEAILDVAFWLFGKLSFAKSENTNFLGIVTATFHAPGYFLTEHLSKAVNLPMTSWVWIAIIIFTGAVQFFLLALLGIMIWKDIRRLS